jgi:hypothetical protein
LWRFFVVQMPDIPGQIVIDGDGLVEVLAATEAAIQARSASKTDMPGSAAPLQPESSAA